MASQCLRLLREGENVNGVLAIFWRGLDVLAFLSLVAWDLGHIVVTVYQKLLHKVGMI